MLKSIQGGVCKDVRGTLIARDGGQPRWPSEADRSHGLGDLLIMGAHSLQLIRKQSRFTCAGKELWEERSAKRVRHGPNPHHQTVPFVPRVSGLFTCDFESLFWCQALGGEGRGNSSEPNRLWLREVDHLMERDR